MRIKSFATIRKNVSRRVKVVVMFFFLLCVQNTFAQGLTDIFLQGIALMEQAQNEKQVKTIKIRVKNGLYIEMVKVEAGTFTMGATSEQEDPYDDDHKPTHQVTLTRDYYIGKYEVTQSLWKAVMGTNPSSKKGSNLPVEKVSWNDCQIFIRKLNAITKRKFRLPTEAEWEYAARGGKYSKGYRYSGSNTLSDVGWYEGARVNPQNCIHPIGSKQPNELGVYDMSGNVAEWCQDWYGKYSSLSQTNPTGSVQGTSRVVRGGDGYGFDIECQNSYRSNSIFQELCTPNYRQFNRGLRLVLTAK
mgnify:CR=1 FL=1